MSAEEDHVKDNAQHERGYDHLRQLFRIKERIYRGQTSLRQGATAWRAMTAMRIVNGKRVAAGGTGF